MDMYRVSELDQPTLPSTPAGHRLPLFVVKFSMGSCILPPLSLQICAVAPVFLVSALVKASSFAKDAKLILLTSEGGSITLRTQKEGGGMFGHHGSKAAANMVSWTLFDRG